MKQDYKESIIWLKALSLVTEIYRTTATFPSDERFGLTSQMRRAAVSIPSNLKTRLLISGNLGMLEDSAPLNALLAEVARLPNCLLNSLKNQPSLSTEN